jgi:hypothetical protein
MTEAQLVAKIHRLFGEQKLMMDSLYNSIIGDHIVDADTELFGLTGRHYPSYSEQEILSCIAEVMLSLRGDVVHFRVGRLDLYTYPASSRGTRFKSYTGHPFYCKNRYFRWEVIVAGHVINLQLYKGRIAL